MKLIANIILSPYWSKDSWFVWYEDYSRIIEVDCHPSKIYECKRLVKDGYDVMVYTDFTK